MNAKINTGAPQRINIVVGTRAQLIKTAPVMKELDYRNIPYRYIFTCQHKVTMTDIMSNFDLKPPDYVLFPRVKDEAKTIALFGNWITRAFLKLLFKKREIVPGINGIILTHGDTVTCWWGAVLGKVTGNKVMHLESGLRSFRLFKPFPEEISRLLTFALTDVYACPNEWALKNVEKYKGIKINTQMNTQYDAVRYAKDNMDKINVIMPEKKYVVASIHRYEHVFNKQKFFEIISILEEIAQSFLVVFVLHPVTLKRIEKYGVREKLQNNPRIKLINRLPFFEFIKLMYHAEFVVTDGGSNQEELSYLGKPALILRDVTERTEGLNDNAVLSKFDRKIITRFVSEYKNYIRPFKKVDHTPSQIVVDWLVNNGYA